MTVTDARQLQARQREQEFIIDAQSQGADFSGLGGLGGEGTVQVWADELRKAAAVTPCSLVHRVAGGPRGLHVGGMSTTAGGGVTFASNAPTPVLRGATERDVREIATFLDRIEMSWKESRERGVELERALSAVRRENEVLLARVTKLTKLCMETGILSLAQAAAMDVHLPSGKPTAGDDGSDIGGMSPAAALLFFNSAPNGPSNAHTRGAVGGGGSDALDSSVASASLGRGSSNKITSALLDRDALEIDDAEFLARLQEGEESMEKEFQAARVHREQLLQRRVSTAVASVETTMNLRDLRYVASSLAAAIPVDRVAKAMKKSVDPYRERSATMLGRRALSQQEPQGGNDAPQRGPSQQHPSRVGSAAARTASAVLAEKQLRERRVLSKRRETVKSRIEQFVQGQVKEQEELAVKQRRSTEAFYYKLMVEDRALGAALAGLVGDAAVMEGTTGTGHTAFTWDREMQDLMKQYCSSEDTADPA